MLKKFSEKINPNKITTSTLVQINVGSALAKSTTKLLERWQGKKKNNNNNNNHVILRIVNKSKLGQ